MSLKGAIPPWVLGVISALHLRDPRPLRLTDAGWAAALAFCDRARLTLTLRDRAQASMPAWVRERTARNAANNKLRLARLLDLYSSLAHFQFVALKGVTQTVLTGAPPESRVQYDLDLLVKPSDSRCAQQVFEHPADREVDAERLNVNMHRAHRLEGVE